MSAREKIRLAFSIVILCLFAYTAIEAWDFSRRARYLPLYVSVAGFILCGLLITLDFWRNRTPEGREKERAKVLVEDYNPEGKPTRAGEYEYLKRSVYYLAWLAGFIASIAIIGLPVASAIFLGAFLWFEGHMKPKGIALSISTMLLCLFGITQLMHLHWPTSLLGW